MTLFDQAAGEGIGSVYSVDTASVVVQVPEGDKLFCS